MEYAVVLMNKHMIRGHSGSQQIFVCLRVLRGR